MPRLQIILEGDGALEGWEDAINVHPEALLHVIALSAGMTGGRPSIAFAFELPNGRKVIAQTSARLFIGAAKAIETKFERELQDDYEPEGH